MAKHVHNTEIGYGSKEGVVDGIPSKTPWTQNGEELKSVSNGGTPLRNYAYQQIRIFNQYDLHEMIHPGYGQMYVSHP